MYCLLFTYLLQLNFSSKGKKRKKLIRSAKRGKYYKYQMWAGYIAQVLIRHFMCFLSQISSIVFHCLTCFQVCLWAHLWLRTPTINSKGECFSLKYLLYTKGVFCLHLKLLPGTLFVSSWLVYGEKLGINLFGCIFHFRVQRRVSNVWQFSR